MAMSLRTPVKPINSPVIISKKIIEAHIHSMESITPHAVGIVIFVILAAVALYYLYQFLYGTSTLTTTTLVSGPTIANTGTTGATTFISTNMPALYEGGDYTINFWLYVNDFNVRRDLNKHVLSIGGLAATGFDTIRIYLGAFRNSLSVRVNSQDATSGASPTGPTQSTALTRGNYAATFSSIPPGLDADSLVPCDLSEIDLQKWINISVVLSGRTVDTYLQGKLARSCVLPSFFKVDPAGYQLTLLDYGGFGGYISNVTLYGSALNPSNIYQIYMSGPASSQSFLGWVESLFSPTSLSALQYPQMN